MHHFHYEKKYLSAQIVTEYEMRISIGSKMRIEHRKSKWLQSKQQYIAHWIKQHMSYV